MKTWLLNIAAVIVPPLLIFINPAIKVIVSNYSYFSVGILPTITDFIIIAILYGGAGAILLLIALRGRHKYLFYAYLLTGPIWVLLGITKSYFPEGITSVAIAVLALLLGTFILRRAALTQVKGAVVLFGALIATSTGVSLTVTDRVIFPQPSTAYVSTEPANDALPNIYHIVMDEFQSDLFAIHVGDDLLETLTGFTFYREATTPFGRTEVALAATLSGTEYRYDRPLADYVHESFAEKSITYDLRRLGYAIDAYLWTSYGQFEFVKQFDEIYWEKKMTSSKILEDHSRILTAVWIYNQLPSILASRLIAPHHYNPLKSGTLLLDMAPAKSLLSFRKFIAEEKNRRPHSRYEFVHLMLPHFPEVLAADCSFTPGQLTSAADQAGCAVRLIEEFVAELKRLDRFDESIVLIQGDHGKWMYYEDGNLVRSKANATGLDWHWGRSRPLVLFKPPGETLDNAKLTVSTRPVTLLDIVPTIRDALGLPRKPAHVGYSLLDREFPEREVRYYHFYEKDRRRLIEGDLHRYRITDEGIAFDSIISIPTK